MLFPKNNNDNNNLMCVSTPSQPRLEPRRKRGGSRLTLRPVLTSFSASSARLLYKLSGFAPRLRQDNVPSSHSCMQLASLVWCTSSCKSCWGTCIKLSAFLGGWEYPIKSSAARLAWNVEVLLIILACACSWVRFLGVCFHFICVYLWPCVAFLVSLSIPFHVIIFVLED